MISELNRKEKDRLKILFFTNIPSPYRVAFFDELAEQCDLTVAYERQNASDRNTNWNSEKKGSYLVYFLKGINYSNDASFSLDFKRFFRNTRYDLIIVSGYSSLTQIALVLYLKRKHIPFIMSIDGAIPKAESRVKRALKTKLISSASYWLSTGGEGDKFLVDHGAKQSRIYRYPFTSISNSQILTRTLSEREKEEYKARIECPSKKVVLSVGQPIHRKGFDILIKAMKRFDPQDVCTVIVGGDPNAECVEELKKALGIDIKFVPFKTKEELSLYYKAADVFAFSTREDIWGLVVNEAMAFGLPIVTTDKCNAGLELVSDDVNGYIIPTEDEDGLYRAIYNLLYEKNLRDFSEESLNKIKPYSIENMANEHIRIFNEIVGGGTDI